MDLVDDARTVSKRCFDEALFDLKRLNDEEKDESLPLMQAIHDNWTLWSYDVISDKKKAEMAELEQ